MSLFRKFVFSVVIMPLVVSCGGGSGTGLLPASSSIGAEQVQDELEQQADPVQLTQEDGSSSAPEADTEAAVDRVEEQEEPVVVGALVDSSVPRIDRLALAVRDQDTTGGFASIQFTNLVEIAEIPDGSLISLDEFAGTQINVLAVSSDEGRTGSIGFELIGPTSLDRHENFPPYTLATEPEHWDVSDGDLLPGEYTLSATPYAGRDLTGGQGETFTISFTVTSDSSTNAGSNDEASVGDSGLPAEPVNNGEVAELLARRDSFSIFQDQTLAQVSVANNDAFDPSLAEYSIVQQPVSGDLQLDIDGSFTYIPQNGFAGSDSFTYEIRQGDDVSSALVQINVLAPVATQSGGWTDFVSSFIVESDGSFSLGDPNNGENPTRDRGSKIVFVDTDFGNNASADYYWYLDGNIVDSSGSATDSQGRAYGTDPLDPNLQAIRPFEHIAVSDSRVRTRASGRFGQLAGMHPDWFLFRRGQTHTKFEHDFTGGQSESKPMVVASYGPLTDRRAIIDPSGRNPFNQHSFGFDRVWYHLAVSGLEMKAEWNQLNFHNTNSFAGGPPTLFAEDVFMNGALITYPPKKSRYRRVTVSNVFNPGTGHIQGLFASGFELNMSLEQVFFYKSGFQSDTRRNADPAYDRFSRNVYQDGGAQMGVTYKNVISMDGGSGGPQMRMGGLMEDSLILEGYFYSSTNSNAPRNPWLEAGNQSGSSAEVRDNVQMIFGYPTAADPNTGSVTHEDNLAQPSWGYGLLGQSFGATVENNIISGAMLEDDLADGLGAAGYGISLSIAPLTYSNGVTYSPRNNVVRNNIVYRTAEGIRIEGDSTGIENIVVEGNTIVSSGNPLSDRLNVSVDSDELEVTNNAVYSDLPPSSSSWISGNFTASYSDGLGSNNLFPDPDRTLKRYLIEVIGVSLLDWEDDPYLDPAQRIARQASGEQYDPAGMKTFAAMASYMRRGGTVSLPSGGAKPVFEADYGWDERLTANAINNWIRAGFGVEPVE